MKLRFAVLLLAILATVLALVAVASAEQRTPAPTPTAVLPPIGSNWHSVFDDEFSDAAKTDQLWSTEFAGSLAPPHDKVTNYTSSTLVESGGLLSIYPRKTASGYESGILYTAGKFQMSYGYVEARVYVPSDGAGGIQNWPAVWMDAANGDWLNGEIDIMEGLGGGTWGHFNWGKTGQKQVWGFQAPGSYAGWHTYAVDWEPGVITWYYDNKQVGQYKSRNVTSLPEFLVLDMELTSDYGGPGIQLPSVMQIDYVRAWQH